MTSSISNLTLLIRFSSSKYSEFRNIMAKNLLQVPFFQFFSWSDFGILKFFSFYKYVTCSFWAEDWQVYLAGGKMGTSFLHHWLVNSLGKSLVPVGALNSLQQQFAIMIKFFIKSKLCCWQTYCWLVPKSINHQLIVGWLFLKVESAYIFLNRE